MTWSDFTTSPLLAVQLRADTISDAAQCFRNELWAHFLRYLKKKKIS